MVWMKVPYTNFHNLNQDWIISMMMEFRETMDHIISLSTVKYADPIAWNITTQYEANTVVIDQQSGIAYLSTQPVPAGINITNTDYWTTIFDLQLFLTGLREGITFAIEASGYASESRAVGDLVWVNSELLEVLTAMSAGDSYNTGVGGNSRRVSIEQLLKDLRDEIGQYVDDLADEITNRENADITLQQNIDQEIADRIAEDARIEAKIVTNQDVYTITPSMVGDYIARGQASAAMVYGDTLYSLSTTNYDDYGKIRRYSISGNTMIDEKRIRVGHGNSIAYNAAENAFYIAPVSRFSGGVETAVQEVFKYDATFTTLTVLQAPGDMHAVSYDSAAGIMYTMRSYHDGTVSIYTIENNAFDFVRTIDLTFMQNANSVLLQDLAVYDGVAYISNYQGTVCKINLATGDLLGMFFVDQIDMGHIYNMGELEGFEFNEDGILYGVFTRTLNYSYDDGDGANVADAHGCFVQIPLRNYTRATVNMANAMHATLSCYGSKETQLYRGWDEILNPSLATCRLDYFNTIKIYDNVTTHGMQLLQKNVTLYVDSTATWTVNRIYLQGGILSLQIDGELITEAQYVIDPVDRAGMILLDIPGTVSGPAATSNSFVRWSNVKIPVAIGRLTGMPNGTIGIMTYQRNPSAFCIGSTLIA